MRKFVFILIGINFFSLSAKCQYQDINLANDYFYKGEWEKAKLIYEKYIKNETSTSLIHKNYLQTLFALQDYKTAERYIKKCIKNNPGVPSYNIDYLVLLQREGKKKEFEKYISSLTDQIDYDEWKTKLAGNALIEQGLLEEAEYLYIQSRKKIGNTLLYTSELMNVYIYKRDINGLLFEFSNLPKPSLDYIQYMLSYWMSQEEKWDELEKSLLAESQKYPSQPLYDQLLVWFYTKKNNIPRAFLIAKALDKRLNEKGAELLKLGKEATTNKSYPDAVSIFAYIVKCYPKEEIGLYAEVELTFIQQSLIEQELVINEKKIVELVETYDHLLLNSSNIELTIQAELIKRVTWLNACYLKNYDIAIEQLQTAIIKPPFSIVFKNQLKLVLGDIYLLKGESGEAALLYTQVYKEEGDTNLGHEAKLKSAKVWYYQGDFKLAQGQLSILKLATSREIANDALDLSLMIQEAIGIDSSETPLKIVAKADWLIFQFNWQEALDQLNYFQSQFSTHPLMARVYWLKSIIYQRTGKYEEALTALKELIRLFPNKPITDDAVYLEALITEENLHDTNAATALYQYLYEHYPDSIYASDARKRFRKLRGENSF